MKPVKSKPSLLQEAWQHMPGVLFDKCDVLVVDEIGKDISGTGMDPNIIGRYTTDAIKGEDKVQRIAVLGLTEKTRGNANGLGLADVCTSRLYVKILQVNSSNVTVASKETHVIARIAFLPRVRQQSIIHLPLTF